MIIILILITRILKRDKKKIIEKINVKSFKRLEKDLLKQLVTCRLNNSLENNQRTFPRKSCFVNTIAYKKSIYK